MKKTFSFTIVLLAIGLLPLQARETIARWRADKPDIKNNKQVFDKINRLPMPFSGKTAAQSGYTVQTPHFWEIKFQKDIYHAAIIFENYPEGFCSDSQRFLSLFIVWKNGQIHYRQVIENDPERIKITDWELCKNDSDIYLVLNYDFQPYFTDTFTDQKNKCSTVLPINGHLHASIADFEGLPIGNLPIKNGIARAKILPQPSPDSGYCAETDNYRRKNPVFQLIFPHCYVVKNGKHIFHIALVDRQHEDLLTVYIWKDRKPHSVYLLDHYEQFYSTPDRLKIKSGPGATRHTQTPAIPVWDSIFLRYVINNYAGGPDSAHVPSTSYYKHNYLTVDLKNPGTYDMRKQSFSKGFVYSPQLK